MRTSRTLALGAASLVLMMSACSPGESGGSPSASEGAPSASEAPKPAVSVGSAGFYEAAVVGEMYAQALEAKGYTVERLLEIGERPAVHAAFDAGEVNLIPEYLGGLAGALAVEPLASDPQEAWDNMQAALADKGWVAFDFSPGTDADGFAVRQETAEQLELVTLTDVAAVADQLVWGLAPGCPENPNCGPGLNEVYGIDVYGGQIEVETLEPCSTAMAEALNNEVIDIAQVCTTQPDIVTFNFALLDDDKQLQPAQNLVPVASQELATGAPDDFAETLNAIQAALTTEVLTQLGVEIVVNQMSLEDVARTFLEDNGLL
jgi:osmoprotectant transport system substrate-binding protein